MSDTVCQSQERVIKVSVSDSKEVKTDRKLQFVCIKFDLIISSMKMIKNDLNPASFSLEDKYTLVH